MLKACEVGQLFAKAGSIITTHPRPSAHAARGDRAATMSHTVQAPAITTAVGRTSAAAPNATPAAAAGPTSRKADGPPRSPDPTGAPVGRVVSAHSAPVRQKSNRPSDRIAVSMYTAGPYSAYVRPENQPACHPNERRPMLAVIAAVHPSTRA